MPRDDVAIAQGTDTRKGYSSAVQAFCNAANGQTVKANGFLSMATEVFLSGGKAPATYGIVGFVYCKSACAESCVSEPNACSRGP